MTDSYNQDNINLRDASPISVQTTDITPIRVSLGALTADGETLTVNIYGGGSAPDDLAATSYTMAVRGTFVREAGVVAASAANFAVDGAGATFSLEVDGDTCQLEITGPAVTVNHRLKVSTIGF